MGSATCSTSAHLKRPENFEIAVETERRPTAEGPISPPDQEIREIGFRVLVIFECRLNRRLVLQLKLPGQRVVCPLLVRVVVGT